jgi:photosystem II stability/assembly factor-like uncharacterized protein
LAGAYNAQIYTSTDSGATWTARDSSRSWYSVASSADGTKLVAVEQGGQIYTSTLGSTVGINGALIGDQYEAVELQYIGNGTYILLSHSGDLTVQ